jgi:hypothetical protein
MAEIMFHLEMRIVNKQWAAHLDIVGAQEKPLFIGSIALGAVQHNKQLEKDFLALMMTVVKDTIKRMNGGEAAFLSQDKLTPKDEKAGYTGAPRP